MPTAEAGQRGRTGHPLIRLAGLGARLPRYLNLAQGLLRERSLTGWRKGALVGAVGYAISPVDLIPGIIPIAGQLDDLAVLLLGIRHALRGCPPAVGAAHLSRVGLTLDILDQDLKVVRAAGFWLAKSAGRLGRRAALLPLQALARAWRTRTGGGFAVGHGRWGDGPR